MQSGSIFFSTGWKRMLGYGESWTGDTFNYWSSQVHPSDLEEVLNDIKRHVDGATSAVVNEHRIRCREGNWKWVLFRGRIVHRDAVGAPLRMVGTQVDISPQKEADLRAADNLHLAAGGSPCFYVLGAVARSIEAKHPEIKCCIMAIDQPSQKLIVVAAPSIPDEFRVAIDRKVIGSSEASTWALALRGQKDIAADIQGSTRWAPYWSVARRAGFAACWTEPILGAERKILGLLSCYLSSCRSATSAELAAAQTGAALAALSLSHATSRMDAEKNALQLRVIYDNTPGMVFYLGVEPGPTYRILDVNKEFLQAVGQTSKVVCGSTVDETLSRESLSKSLSSFGKAIKRKQTVRWEQVSTYRGRRAYERASVTPVCNEMGEVTHLVGIIHDVTKSKLIAQELVTASKRLDLVLRIADIELWRQDRRLRYTWSFHSRRDLPRDAYVGKSDAQIWPAKSANLLTQLKRRVLATGRPLRKEVELELPGGRTAYYDLRLIPVKDTDGRVTGLAGVALNNTRLRAADRALEASKEHIAFLAAAREEEKKHFRDLTLEWKATQRERMRLANELHDGILQFLVASDYQLQAVEALPPGSEGLEERVRLVRRLLQQMKRELRHNLWGLNSVAQENNGFMELLRQSLTSMPHWSPSAIIVDSEGPARRLSPRVSGSLLLVIREAVTNAFAHGAAKHVEVSVAFGPRATKIRIKDDGKGFAVKKLKTIEPGHFGVQGMRRRVHLLDGTLRITSTPGKGACVSISVPLKRADTSAA